MSNDLYTESPKVLSVCKLCGDRSIRLQKNGKGRKAFYYKSFAKTSIFRGEDRYLGRICKNCINEGRLPEMENFNV